MTKYVLTFAALLVLTLATLGLSFLELGAWGPVLAMGIAATKSLLIALWFMHLVEHEVASRVAFLVAATLAVVLVAFTALDVTTRDREDREEGPVGAADVPAAEETAGAPDPRSGPLTPGDSAASPAGAQGRISGSPLRGSFSRVSGVPSSTRNISSVGRTVASSR